MTGELHENEITDRIIGAAIEVHRQLGPGLLEATYETCLLKELSDRHLNYERQKVLPISYKGILLDGALRMDLVVEGRVVVELKCVARLEPVHEAQLLTYLRLSGCKVGLLINFHVPVLRRGLRRLVNGFSPKPSSASPRLRGGVAVQ